MAATDISTDALQSGEAVRFLVRPSARVKTVAKMLEQNESQIRRLVEAGELEAHRCGKRGIRVFLDSVAALQARAQIQAKIGRGIGTAAVRRRRIDPRARAAVRNALAELHALGVL